MKNQNKFPQKDRHATSFSFAFAFGIHVTLPGKVSQSNVGRKTASKSLKRKRYVGKNSSWLDREIPRKPVKQDQSPNNNGYRSLRMIPTLPGCLQSESEHLPSFFESAPYKLYLKRYFQCNEDVDRQFNNRITKLEHKLRSKGGHGHRILNGRGMRTKTLN